MAISTLQGSCAAAEYILEGQMHLPLCYVNFCTSYIVGVHRLEKKSKKNKTESEDNGGYNGQPELLGNS